MPSQTSDRTSDEGTRDYCCKLARLAVDYGLPDLDHDLVTRRRTKDDSLRDLAAYVNDSVTATAVFDESELALAAPPGDIRRVVTGDGAGTDLAVDERERIATELEHSTVDVDALERDFVSHETVRTHLDEHLDVDTSRDVDPTTIPDTREMIASIRERDASVVERAIRALEREGRIGHGSVEATLTIRVTCSACGRSYSIDEFLDDEGCRCTDTAP